MRVGRLDVGPPDTSSGRRAGKRRGQSLVELALALPLLLLIMLGTIDLGRLFFDYVQLRNAVREGAAYGARTPSDTTGIKKRVLDHTIPAGVTDSSITVDCGGSCTTIAVGETRTLTVTADHTFKPITTNFLARYGLDKVPLKITASMRVLS